MPFYRTADGQASMHVNFGRRRRVPVPCAGPAAPGDNLTISTKCRRMSVALCDRQVGNGLDGKPVTCDAPVCERHRTKVGPDLDWCWRHATKGQP